MQKKYILSMITGLLIILFLSGMLVHAEEHYDVYNYDQWEEAIPSQAGYSAVRSISGRDLGIENFSEPSDLFRDAHDQIFIVDTKNNRIVVTNSDLTQIVRVMKKFRCSDGSVTTLKEPQGIYISPETNLIYIADYGNSRVLICDENSHIIMEVTKPDSELFSQELTFMPQRVIADKAGNIYIVLGNITTGAAMFNQEGKFQGYYGANTVEATSKVIADYFWKRISTEEIRSRTARTIPSGITSFDLDDEGFIYTCTQSISQKKDTVKKLNPAGKNLFSALETVWGDDESIYDSNTNKKYQSMICDIEIEDNGNIDCLDLTSGRVFQYDKEGNLLFIFGSLSDQLGGFTEVRAIESIDHKILVLDARKNTITVFEETDFGRIVHQATELYNDGYYEEALEPWYRALQYDGNYRRAFLGISAGLLIKGDYAGSMKYAKLADSSYRYNKAFECYRSEWLTEHIQSIIIVIILIGTAMIVLKWNRRNQYHNGFHR